VRAATRLQEREEAVALPMPTRYLAPLEVLATIVRPVRKLHAVERHELEVWPYVDEIPEPDLRGFSIDGNDVECVFRGSDDHYDHVLIPTQTWNTYLLVIVDRANNDILGHHVMCRNDLYDLRVLR
jgi:hypothetical protein